jgi:HSP20 family molecular chaperone IbpA
MKKPSFLDRLTGSVPVDNEYDESITRQSDYEEDSDDYDYSDNETEWDEDMSTEPEQQPGELSVDMYQTRDTIVIRALVAGVSPNDMDIQITRDTVTIKGLREEYQESTDDNYYHRELFWGSFTRTLLLPEEVVIDEAEASEKHGLLEIRLPKLDKHRSTQLRVKSGSVK